MARHRTDAAVVRVEKCLCNVRCRGRGWLDIVTHETTEQESCRCEARWNELEFANTPRSRFAKVDQMQLSEILSRIVVNSVLPGRGRIRLACRIPNRAQYGLVDWLVDVEAILRLRNGGYQQRRTISIVWCGERSVSLKAARGTLLVTDDRALKRVDSHTWQAAVQTQTGFDMYVGSKK